MDSWLESPLNKAHFYERKANALVKRSCFDEAIECHLSAVTYLIESLKKTNNDKARESIQLQKEYHLKQKEVLRLKKLQHQAFKEVIRVQKEAMSRMMKVRESNGKYSGSDNEESLQKAIYKTIEEADSLLEILVHKDESNEGNLESSKNSGGTLVKMKGTIQPKDDKTVIEELRIVNYQLRTLISELMSKLTASEKEVETLKQKVAELEAENRRLAPKFLSASDYSSPFVFSPEDELPPKEPSELPALAPIELPTLAPLEMPNFDLTVLHKKYPSNSH